MDVRRSLQRAQKRREESWRESLSLQRVQKRNKKILNLCFLEVFILTCFEIYLKVVLNVVMMHFGGLKVKISKMHLSYSIQSNGHGLLPSKN